MFMLTVTRTASSLARAELFEDGCSLGTVAVYDFKVNEALYSHSFLFQSECAVQQSFWEFERFLSEMVDEMNQSETDKELTSRLVQLEASAASEEDHELFFVSDISVSGVVYVYLGDEYVPGFSGATKSVGFYLPETGELRMNSVRRGLGRIRGTYNLKRALVDCVVSSHVNRIWKDALSADLALDAERYRYICGSISRSALERIFDEATSAEEFDEMVDAEILKLKEPAGQDGDEIPF